MSRLDELYAAIMDYDDVDGMVAAVEALDAEASPEWLPTLNQWLETPDDFFLREAAATPIARLEGISSLPKLLQAQRLGSAENHDNDGLAFTIVELVEANKPDARVALRELARSSNDEDDRSDAAWLLGFVGEDSDRDLFFQLASDDPPSVRAAACGSLASLDGRPGVFDCLVERLSDDSLEVVISAASALGYSGDKRALEQLRRLIPSQSDQLQAIVEYAIELLEQRTPAPEPGAEPL